ncbi:MAG: PIN domain-containing protein [Dehalococcoidia bacterium]|nr:PIN domain-containing protein [Planctomycetota bacterium]MDP7091029.1 PIN domain-containing protein [Dehalococcoidia bacterium]
MLNIAYHAAKEYPDRQVSLVTKDVNLRMKARGVGIRSEDYRSDRHGG